MTAPGRFRWIADAGGFAHAVPPRGRVTRAACGILLDDVLPTTGYADRCGRCLARVGLSTAAEPSARKLDTPAPTVRRVDAGGHS